MKTYIILILVGFLPVLSCSRTDTSFYDKVLSDFSDKSYFIALDIKSSAYKGRVIIENNDLYNYLNKTESWDKISYKSKLEKILIHSRKLKVNSTDLIKWKFIRVNEVNNVYLNANKGMNSFIATYFEGVLFRYDVNEEEMHAVINQLFYWKIPVRFDKLSGQLMLEN